VPFGQSWGDKLNGAVSNNPYYNYSFPPVTFQTDSYYGWDSSKLWDEYHTVYGLDDRYRGIHGGRQVVFVSPGDIAELGFSDGDLVDIVGIWPDRERRARGFRIVSYPTPRGSAAAYYPETNVLVPLDSTAAESNTPTSKSIEVRLERTEQREPAEPAR